MNKPAMKQTCQFVKVPFDLACRKLNGITIHVGVHMYILVCFSMPVVILQCVSYPLGF